MNIGSKIRFSFTNNGACQQTTLTLSATMVSEDVLSDAEVAQRLAPRLKQMPVATLVRQGYILAARNLLAVYPDATDINMQNASEQQTGGNAGGAVLILAVLAIIVAIICFPLLVMLGMHGKLFLKGFYEKCEGDDYKKFTKNYTFIGIGLYALTAILFAVDKIFKLYVLSGPAFGILFVGGIAYFVISLLLTKKKFLGEDHAINFMETLKSGFKKEKK